ncbi:endoribonuclease YbeY-like [Physella acuta]|uniref:endoribonuclease YbeY-like n=1 Tax=Physella acuta TaxID=109671 RepID=UPI0027DCE4B1|nr:endoribonuclease YbeY-like [Physella acuta]XP_059155695.1 endoribonuclease YbeY-like [Physella acuta]XP_059155696.1 endoribonuclease YbeY-like [Physella acuta]
MSVIIRNLQSKIQLNLSQLHYDAVTLLKLTQYHSYDLGIMLVSSNEIKALNKKYRRVNRVTDVLAFPFLEVSHEQPGVLPNVDQEDRMLGDIALCTSFIWSESQKHKEDFNSVMLTMVTHGLCHLVGFDHETKDQWTQMYRKELEILTRFNQLTGYRCSPLLGVGHFEAQPLLSDQTH